MLLKELNTYLIPSLNNLVCEWLYKDEMEYNLEVYNETIESAKKNIKDSEDIIIKQLKDYLIQNKDIVIKNIYYEDYLLECLNIIMGDDVAFYFDYCCDKSYEFIGWDIQTPRRPSQDVITDVLALLKTLFDVEFEYDLDEEDHGFGYSIEFKSINCNCDDDIIRTRANWIW